MKGLKTLRTVVNYKVPKWEFCNFQKMYKPTDQVCRFCVSTKNSNTCALHNMPLDMVDGRFIRKTSACLRLSAGYNEEIEEQEEPRPVVIDPMMIIKVTLAEYTRAYNDLINQGLPARMAEKAAKDYVLKG